MRLIARTDLRLVRSSSRSVSTAFVDATAAPLSPPGFGAPSSSLASSRSSDVLAVLDASRELPFELDGSVKPDDAVDFCSVGAPPPTLLLVPASFGIDPRTDITLSVLANTSARAADTEIDLACELTDTLRLRRESCVPDLLGRHDTPKLSGYFARPSFAFSLALAFSSTTCPEALSNPPEERGVGDDPEE